MKVICAGFSKTGTKTMCSAFNMLGYNTYDYPENANYLYKGWNKIMTTGATSEEIRKMFEGVDAVTDSPCFQYWEELHHAFPEAKIILTIRDEDSWLKSLLKQMDEINKSWFAVIVGLITPWSLLRGSYRKRTFQLLAEICGWPFLEIQLKSGMQLRRAYRQHNDYVLKHAPKDKLLVYKVTDGWGPLCSFLGKKVPKIDFPHKNKGATVIEELKKENKVIKHLIFEASAMLGLTAAFVGYLTYKSYGAWPIW